MAGNGAVLAVVETSAGSIRESCYELLTAASEIAAGEVVALVVGDDVADVASDVSARGAGRVLVAESSELNRYSTAGYTQAIEAAIGSVEPDVVLLSGTTSGRDLGPYLAARRGQECLVDCVSVSWDGSTLSGTRPVYQGKMVTDVSIETQTPAFAVIRSGAFAQPDAGDASGDVATLDVAIEPGPIKAVGLSQPKAGSTGLEDADVVICGGRGIGSADGFEMLNELAELLDGAVGATRAATDLGWRAHNEQIGQTGANVRPKLYLGVGVSGAVQHTVGMQNSETIVAINRDPDAPIFRLAEIGVIGDLHEIVPALLDELRAAKGGAS